MAEETLFLLDTNVLIHDAKALYSFGKNVVAIPFTVLEELDQFKKDTTDRGHSARAVIRDLDMLRSRGSLAEGVTLDNGGVLKVIFLSKDSSPSSPLFLDVPDNDIIRIALGLKRQGHNVRFISKDINARVKADVLGIRSEDYMRGAVPADEIYKGWVTVEAAAVQLKKSEPEELTDLLKLQDLSPNEFVFMTARNNPFNFRIFRYMGGSRFKPVDAPQLQWPVTARNPQQLMALDLLFDPEVKMVSLLGPAGTGKTFLALLAGLHQVLVTDEYRRVLVSRPVIPLGPDIGYLPGDIQEKLRSWMQPMYDNIDLIAHAAAVGRHVASVGQEMDEQSRRKQWKKHEKEKRRSDWQDRNHGRSVDDRDGQRGRGLQSLDQLAREGKISLEAITYMRGRSIPYQFILIDEVQNLSPHEVKTLVSRVGEGSKIVLAGDPFQIDSPYLDLSSNGLVVATNRFRGQQIFGTVFLQTSERSELSKIAGEIL